VRGLVARGWGVGNVQAIVPEDELELAVLRDSLRVVSRQATECLLRSGNDGVNRHLRSELAKLANQNMVPLRDTTPCIFLEQNTAVEHPCKRAGNGSGGPDLEHSWSDALQFWRHVDRALIGQHAGKISMDVRVT
jgi:hypothetical protein